MPTGILSEGEAEGGSEVTPKEEPQGSEEPTEEPEEETLEMPKAPCWAPCSGLRHLWGVVDRESGLSHFTAWNSGRIRSAGGLKETAWQQA